MTMLNNTPFSPLYITSIGQRTKEVIIQELRYYFQTVSSFNGPGVVQTPVIREAYGVDLRNYPAVFVKIINTREKTLGLGNGFVGWVWSDDQEGNQQYLPGTENLQFPVAYKPRAIAQRFGYMADITFQLQVWGDTVVVRNRIVDEIKAAFQTFQKISLEQQGIVVVDMSEGEEQDFPLNDTTHIFVANISLVVNAELYFDFPVSSITQVEVYQSNIPPYPDLSPYIIQNQNEPL